MYQQNTRIRGVYGGNYVAGNAAPSVIPANQNVAAPPAPSVYSAPPPAERPATPQYPPQQNASGNPQNASPAASAGEYINSVITNRSTNKAAMDFSCRLVKAHNEDYAMIHGCGGKKHAANSGIQLSICDFSKGKGDASVNVSFIIDVREISRLRVAVEAAVLGTLGLTAQMKGAREFATANGMIVGWLQGQHQPTFQELVGLQQVMQVGLAAQDPENRNENQILWAYEMQKNNPYRTTHVNGKEYAPCSTLSIQYTPARNYAWTLRVSNFEAPLVRRDNGATTHNAKEAINTKTATYRMTTDDLFCALTDVESYIRLWEYRMYPIINAMSSERERRLDAKRKK